MALQTVSDPAATYAAALERARAFMARDDDGVAPVARTALHVHGERRPLAIVLLHGYTNNPAQYAQFAPMLYERGANVLVPRMPLHGERDRMTTRLAHLTAEMLLASASEALDIACGLGSEVAVLGISMGGCLAAYFAQFREIALAVPVAPDFSLLQLPYGVSSLAGKLLRALPNFFLWWDPRVRERQLPATAYPRFSTRALAQTLRVGDDVHAASRREDPRAARIVVMVNRTDPAVNNGVAKYVAGEWSNRRGGAGVEYVELRGLPTNHDIIDPQNPLARTDLVYPKLLEALGVQAP